MIVVALISILSVGATLSVGHRDRQANSDVAILRDTLANLRSEAVLSGRQAVLALGPDRLARAEIGPDGLQLGTPQRLRGTLTVTSGTGTTRDGDWTLIHLLPDRRSSSFELLLDGPGGTWLCLADGWQDLSCEAQS